VALVIPVWGLVMLGLGLEWGEGWWIASGAVVLAIGAVLFCRSSLVAALIPGGRRFG
jgi:hypothetical protein